MGHRSRVYPADAADRWRSPGRTPGLTWDYASAEGVKNHLGSTDNAEADGSIPSSPTKDLLKGHFWNW